PVYWYDHEWLDTNKTYGSPNAPTLLNRLFISQGPHLGPFAGKLTIESFPGFEDRTFIYVRCDI
ncbi:MAG: hypothetical protein NTV34_19870, partial [Proteobacteria bacterium]|nr:hypothetical protein [Pseudomonadota bacterium]